MRLDRALSQVQALGDAGVGQPLCHQLEHLAFALRELGKRVVAASNRDQADDAWGSKSLSSSLLRHAAALYSLMSPPRTSRRSMRSVGARKAVAKRGSGGWSERERCGRCRLKCST